MKPSMGVSKGELQRSGRKAQGITVIINQLRSFQLKHKHLTKETSQSIGVEEVLGEEPEVLPPCLDCRQRDRQEETGKPQLEGTW